MQLNLFSNELSGSQIEQQDFMDNVCFDLIKKLAPEAEWDIQHISAVRDMLISILVSNYGKDEYELYPWIEEN